MLRARRKRYDTEERRLDRARTKAWAQTLDPSTVGIWVHAAARYPLGCVAVDEYETVRADLIRQLRAFVSERGLSVFSAVERREDVYSGAYVDQAPDILASFAPEFGAVYG